MESCTSCAVGLHSSLDFAVHYTNMLPTHALYMYATYPCTIHVYYLHMHYTLLCRAPQEYTYIYMYMYMYIYPAGSHSTDNLEHRHRQPTSAFPSSPSVSPRNFTSTSFPFSATAPVPSTVSCSIAPLCRHRNPVLTNEYTPAQGQGHHDYNLYDIISMDRRQSTLRKELGTG